MDKFSVRVLGWLLMAVLCVCCGGDAGGDRDEPRLPETSEETQGSTTIVTVTSQSITQGETVDADKTVSLTLTYSSPISIEKPELITINDRVITDASTSGNALTLPLALEPATAYTIIVPSDALTAGVNTKVKAFALNFSTRATINTDLLTTSLCNSNADDEAKSLFGTFLSIYGKKTIPGVTESNINDNTCVEYVFSVSQQHPAIIGYNLNNIHTADYSDITQIISHHNAGGMVCFGWEWLTPSHESDSPENYSADSGFDITKAVNNTTWQYAFVENDIDIVATLLRALEDAGIPVLFNPLCDAQNHWWGQKGAPYFRELWKLLYDRLTIKHELNNLIWVWSSDFSNLSAEDAKEWYPGDKFVDIVGTSLSTESSEPSIDIFLRINETFGGKKMIALTKCETIPVIDDCFSNGDTWLYFVVPQEFATTANIDWKSIMTHTDIITRDRQ